MIFRLNGTRKLPNAPIKIGQTSRSGSKNSITRLPKHGSITLLGRPVPITDAIERWILGKADTTARKRIFSDDYYSPGQVIKDAQASSEAVELVALSDRE